MKSGFGSLRNSHVNYSGISSALSSLCRPLVNLQHLSHCAVFRVRAHNPNLPTPSQPFVEGGGLKNCVQDSVNKVHSDNGCLLQEATLDSCGALFFPHVLSTYTLCQLGK